jgi:hypothetical protein
VVGTDTLSVMMGDHGQGWVCVDKGRDVPRGTCGTIIGWDGVGWMRTPINMVSTVSRISESSVTVDCRDRDT